MKYTLSSQEYNELFRNASEAFDMEIAKRDLAIRNMSKKLMIIEYANEFIENKIEFIGEEAGEVYSSSGYTSKLITFNNSLGEIYNQFGHSVHPKFKRDPIDIFNLKLTTGNTMFKNSLICKVNDKEITDENDECYYTNFLVADDSIDKKIMFHEHLSEELKIEYYIDPNNKMTLGTSRFNVIEIDPYIYGAYNVRFIEIFSLSEMNGVISEIPIKTISGINNIGKIRIILDEKVKFSKVVFHFNLSNVRTQKRNQDVFPFGLKHIHFYEADFLEDSYVIVPIRANDYIEYIYNDIKLYHAGETIDATCDFYNIEIYTDFINNTLTGRVYTSSDAQAYRITKNTKMLYAKIPLIWTNQANKNKQYLSLTGIMFNYTVDETEFL
jgi:hypothetical protein